MSNGECEEVQGLKTPKNDKSPGNGLSSQAVSHQVLSLLARFTTVFGMGTGGTMLPYHQGVSQLRENIYLDNCIDLQTKHNVLISQLNVKRSNPRPISTTRLHTLLHFHL